ncbi:MAG: c-type cytochrome biogenesis protein CcsB [Bacteroidetes bacterium GWA2_40_14]|nr:MAG: c-type cytochrome biogenesis protein CcsB [Bacteroidetes bacterium GWA2_40_14]HAZ03352.1 c-type cytochrome biogenesis protein CcsB [Marinilabiliales bacterium]
MKKLWNMLISPITMGVLLFIGAFAMGMATFIENDFGSGRARELVYGAKWFELLMVLFMVNLVGSIFHRKLYLRKKLTIFVFHIAFIVMILGAAVTRYFGYEGMMHIREGESSDLIQTQNESLNVEVAQHGKVYKQNWGADKVNRKSGFKGKVKTENGSITFKMVEYLPDAYEKAVVNPNGNPVIGFVMADESFRGMGYIEQGTIRTFGNRSVAFDASKKADVNFSLKGDSIFIEAGLPIYESQMGSQEGKATHQPTSAITLKKLYQVGATNLVIQEFLPTAEITAMAASNNTKGMNKPAYKFEVLANNHSYDFVVWGGSNNSMVSSLEFDDIKVEAGFGFKHIELPFQLQLDNFEIERYPGSHSPSSFSSYVQVLQPGKNPEPFHIYMNNILKMHGYRFYQSSYDNDEKGTILSVNYDNAGTTTTYVGYFLLFLGIVLSMFNKNSFLKNTYIPKLVALLLVSSSLWVPLQIKAGNEPELKINTIDAKHAERFGQLLIQDNKGRTEPIYTFSSDLVRKISRKEQMHGLTPVQLFLEMNMNYSDWVDVPIIKVSNKKLQDVLGITTSYASYNDFIVSGTGYKLQPYVEAAFNKPPARQDKFDKEVIKVDERLNITYAIFTGAYFKVFPVPNSNEQHWFTSDEAQRMAKNPTDSSFLANILPIYFQELHLAKETGNYAKADEYLEAIFTFQTKFSNYELPSSGKVKLEVMYNKWNIFKKLFPFYATCGVLFLLVLIAGIIRGRDLPGWLTRTFVGFIFIGFLFHILGIIARWYISGHAPMSNGYESLVFISGVTMLAGFIFSRQSLMALSATSVLAGFTLMVANLSFMDPEITNLVPVLKSYWLTVHVSVITGSYGFLGLGALLGIVNLILTISKNSQNRDRIETSIETLTKINHRTLILGLYFISIGTFLGAVWANESWGRYWGWDPKETWSLITMIIYTFVTHARLIPGMRGRFAFNTLSIYAFFSVLMTYFGVNYYLSGLHSYASGDPVPIPTSVYVSVITLVILSVWAWFRNVQNEKSLNK